ncbi:hypothetical protein AB0E69_35100 [Kribbella sp. NPDC026611]|uniref:hypothetical protein n=1 Tax=Kribbella sp. NPDC026611 TaxID=3154911 RepID=UPI0033F60786
MYVVGTINNKAGSFRLDLRHPLLGPLTAYIPVVALLLISNYARELGVLAQWLTFAAIAALAINAAQLVAHWLSNPFDRNALHPRYLLPVTAGPFIAAITLARMNDGTAAVADLRRRRLLLATAPLRPRRAGSVLRITALVLHEPEGRFLHPHRRTGITVSRTGSAEKYGKGEAGFQESLGQAKASAAP